MDAMDLNAEKVVHLATEAADLVTTFLNPKTS